MSEIKSIWHKQSAWEAVGISRRYGVETSEAGVEVELLHSAEVLGLMARHRSATQAAATMRRHYGIDLPLKPAAISSQNFDVIWSAPDQWFAFSRMTNGLTELGRTMADTVAVVDQTGARGVLHVSGPLWRRALAKGCPLDLHSDAFPDGYAAATVINLIGANLWRRPGDEGIYIAVFRSMAESFWRWLRDSSEEFGMHVF